MTIVYCKTCGTFQDKDTWDKEGTCEWFEIPSRDIIFYLNRLQEIKEAWKNLSGMMER